MNFSAKKYVNAGVNVIELGMEISAPTDEGSRAPEPSMHPANAKGRCRGDFMSPATFDGRFCAAPLAQHIYSQVNLSALFFPKIDP